MAARLIFAFTDERTDTAQKNASRRDASISQGGGVAYRIQRRREAWAATIGGGGGWWDGRHFMSDTFEYPIYIWIDIYM